MIFFIKYWVSLLWLVGCVGLFGNKLRDWRLVWVVPFVLVALFLHSLAVVQIKNWILRYRRFVKWTTITRSEVISCGLVWPPFVGYIRLNHFVLPCGRIYFVLDYNPYENPFRRPDFDLLRFIRGVPSPVRGQLLARSVTKNRNLGLKLLAAGVLGALISILRPALSPSVSRSVFEQPTDAGQPAWLLVPNMIQHLLDSPPGGRSTFWNLCHSCCAQKPSEKGPGPMRLLPAYSSETC